MKLIHYKPDGQIWGYYDPNIHADIPTPNVAVSDEVWQECVERGATHISLDNLTPILPPPKPISLDELKQQKLNEINAAFRAERERSSVEVEGVGVVDAGERYLINIDALLALVPSSGEVDFILADNSTKKLGRDLLKRIKLAIAQAGAELYAKRHALRQAIQKANSEAELEAIKWHNA